MGFRGGHQHGAPQWAGLIALANQQRASEQLPPLTGYNQTLPALYSLPAADFHDITTGSNQSGISAGPGYDEVTGLGTPVANLLVPALAAAGTTSSPPATQVNLSSSYNRIGIFADGVSYPYSAGLDGDGYAYSGTQLTSPVSGDGQQFALGPVGGNDAVSAVGQTIALPSGTDSQLLLLGTGVNGNQAGLTFTVTYSDGSTGTFTQSFSDWHTPQGYGGESAATSSMSYRDTNSGGSRARCSTCTPTRRR